MSLTFVVSGKNLTYTAGHWGEFSLYWWSIGRMLLTLVVNVKNVFTLVFSGRMSLSLVVSGRMSLTLVVNGKNVTYNVG
ncbi:unnamed protein product [Staurois parvus]|uniref:Uncharacterized protein n=1 Tax=Staurois parvus TaxID=386267 RepID=A0ABN9BP48_9NEOB|nr:unnamed protein product [Staurois parvus]